MVLDYLGYRTLRALSKSEPAAKANILKSLYHEHITTAGDDATARLLALLVAALSYVMRLLGSLTLYEEILERGLKVDLQEVSFSILTLALNYSRIVEFLGLASLTREAFAQFNRNHLADLAEWLFVDKDSLGTTQLGDSRNMKFLAAAIAHEEGLAALRRGESAGGGRPSDR